MKFALVAVSAAFFVLSTAQNLSGLPKCAQTCVGSSLGGCNSLDISCICSNKAFITNISCCVAGKCSEADQEATIKFANQICAVAKVTLPQAAGCSATPTGSSGSGASGSGSNATISTSVMVSSTSTSSSVTANPSSANTAASAVSTSPSESASGANIQSVTSSTASSSSASSSSAAPASTSGAAGNLGLDSAMGAAGLAAAAFALL